MNHTLVFLTISCFCACHCIQELSDLSDSEMFKLDDMLAEVFRQKKKASGGKKAREEKKAELANFRLRWVMLHWD